MTPFIIEIVIRNGKDEKSVINQFSMNDMVKFASFIAMIKNNLEHSDYYNWFKKLPAKYEYENDCSVLDIDAIKEHFITQFGFYFEDYLEGSESEKINSFKEFFYRFTPDGAEEIVDIKLYNVDELKL